MSTVLKVIHHHLRICYLTSSIHRGDQSSVESNISVQLLVGVVFDETQDLLVSSLIYTKILAWLSTVPRTPLMLQISVCRLLDKKILA